MSEQLKDFLWFMVKIILVIVSVAIIEGITFGFLSIKVFHLVLGTNSLNTAVRLFIWSLIGQALIILVLGLLRAIKNLSRPEYNSPKGYVPNQ